MDLEDLAYWRGTVDARLETLVQGQQETNTALRELHSKLDKRRLRDRNYAKWGGIVAALLTGIVGAYRAVSAYLGG